MPTRVRVSIRPMSVTATDLQAFLDGPHAAVRDRVREWLSQEGNAPA